MTKNKDWTRPDPTHGNLGISGPGPTRPAGRLDPRTTLQYALFTLTANLSNLTVIISFVS